MSEDLQTICDVELSKAFRLAGTSQRLLTHQESSPDNALIREYQIGRLNIRVYEVVPENAPDDTTFVLLFSYQEENLFHTHGMWLLGETDEAINPNRVLPFCLTHLQLHMPVSSCGSYPINDLRGVKFTDLGETLASDLINNYRTFGWC